VRKPEGKRPFGRARSRWDDNIKLGSNKLLGTVTEAMSVFCE